MLVARLVNVIYDEMKKKKRKSLLSGQLPSLWHMLVLYYST